jgi:hypothetical protein
MYVHADQTYSESKNIIMSSTTIKTGVPAKEYITSIVTSFVFSSLKNLANPKSAILNYKTRIHSTSYFHAKQTHM